MRDSQPPVLDVDLDVPGLWLGSTPLLDLEDTKLRLRVQSLTQLSKTPREKALAVYAFVKRLPLCKQFKMRLHTAREVLDQGRGDWTDKATVMVAMFRAAGFPARIRYLTLRGDVMRGLHISLPSPTRPVVEVWLNGAWVGTDTYIFDATYAAAAQRRLLENDWECGYGMHINGRLLWDGNDAAYAFGSTPEEDSMVVQQHGLFCDPLEFVSSESYRATHTRLSRTFQWNVFAPAIERAIRGLRQDFD